MPTHLSGSGAICVYRITFVRWLAARHDASARGCWRLYFHPRAVAGLMIWCAAAGGIHQRAAQCATDGPFLCRAERHSVVGVS